MKAIITKINEYFTSSVVYRGIGPVNATYGGSDKDMGVFWTDNYIMASWFAGLVEYDPSLNLYVNKESGGRVIESRLRFENPYIIDSDDSDEDSFQMYINAIKKIGGVNNYKSSLKNYDGIILKNNTTNYYLDGTYNIYIEISYVG